MDPELLKSIVKIWTSVAVTGLMFSSGLNMAPGHLMFFRGRFSLLLKSLLAVLVFVPLTALVVVYLIQPVHGAAVGIAIMASSPAAPLMLTRASKAAGRLEFIGSLHLILAFLSIAATPATLAIMAASIGFEARIDPLQIAKLAFTMILLPVGLGLFVRKKYPRTADRLSRPLTRVCGLLLIIVVVVLFAMTYRFLFEMDFRSYAAVALFIALALAAGHFSAPDVFEEKTALALEAAGRNPGFALVIAQLNFPHAKPVAFLMPYLLVFFLLSAVYISWHKRRKGRTGRR
jgi:BASS family bile acid:Na+ symporter